MTEPTAKGPEPPKVEPQPAAKIGDKRPTANPYYKETMTGYNSDGTPVWRKLR